MWTSHIMSFKGLIFGHYHWTLTWCLGEIFWTLNSAMDVMCSSSLWKKYVLKVTMVKSYLGQVGHAATAFWGFHGMKESYLSPQGDALAWHSVHWAPDQEVWVQDPVRSMCCVLGKNNWLSPCLSQPRSINGYWWIVREAWWNAGG